MKTAPYGAPEHDEWDDTDEQPLALPTRPRRSLGGAPAAVLLALLVGAICFYVGIRVEKGQVSSTSASTGTGTGSRLAALLSGRGATGSGTGTAGAGAAGSGGGGGGGGFAGGGFARALGGSGSNSSVGTIASVSGNTLYLTDLTGNTVKVTLSSATTITKSLPVSTKSVHPGDTVIVSGLKGSNGTISAATVTDSGNRSGGTGSGSSSSSSSASSAVSSLFGGG